MSDFARNIKRRRAERGMSQEQLAEKLGVTRQTVSNWEQSDSRRRHGLHILRFAAAAWSVHTTWVTVRKRAIRFPWRPF